MTLPATILYLGQIDVTTGRAMEKGIGIRALRDGLTRHLARVRRGARLLITDRGTPIAVLAPYEEGKRGSRRHAWPQSCRAAMCTLRPGPFVLTHPWFEAAGGPPRRS